MPRKNIIKQTTEFTTSLTRLAFLALGGVLAFIAVLLIGNIAIYTLSRVTETLFDLIRAIFEG